MYYEKTKRGLRAAINSSIKQISNLISAGDANEIQALAGRITGYIKKVESIDNQIANLSIIRRDSLGNYYLKFSTYRTNIRQDVSLRTEVDSFA